MISGATEQELEIANARADLLLEIKDKDKEIERLNKRVEDLKIINEEHQILNGMIRKELQQKENIIKGLDNTIENLEEVVEHKENIIKEVREYVENNTLYSEDYDYDEEDNLKWNGAYDYKEREELLEILDKEVE